MAIVKQITISLSSIFNPPTRYEKKVVTKDGEIVGSGEWANGDPSSLAIDFLLEGHLDENELASTNVFGDLFKTGSITFGEVQSLHSKVLAVFTEDQPLLVDGLTKSTTFDLVATRDPKTEKTSRVRQASARQGGRPITFLSLRIPRANRVEEAPVFD